MPNFEVHLNSEGGVGVLPSEVMPSTSKYEATTYKVNYPNHTTGNDLVGRACPACGSSILTRINGSDGRRFMACDKSKKPYCRFTISPTETIGQRTERLNDKLSKIHPGVV